MYIRLGEGEKKLNETCPGTINLVENNLGTLGMDFIEKIQGIASGYRLLDTHSV